MGRSSPVGRTLITVTMLALAGAAYVISYRETKIDPALLIRSLPKAERILTEFSRIEVLTRGSETQTFDVLFPVPCDSAPTPPPMSGTPHLEVSPPCANPRDVVTVRGIGFPPGGDVKLQWLLPSGLTMFSKLASPDADGAFSVDIEVRPITAAQGNSISHIQAELSSPVGGLVPSQTLRDVTDSAMVTIFMALLATTLGAVVAIPLSFLAARNITGRSWAGRGVYFLTRFVLNLTRAYEPLVLAMVLALWVGFGSFAGTLALTIVTVASLGKLFSEAVEHIDPGPLEAIAATGAPPVAVVPYAVVPQVIPDFVSYIIYHWDINVRISTILGFVGGGGIGYYLSQRISALEYGKAGTAIAAIVLVVWSMDFLSAEVRKRYT